MGEKMNVNPNPDNEEDKDTSPRNRDLSREEMKRMSKEEIARTTEARDYLKTDNMETGEERRKRKGNVKKMLDDVRDSQVGVHDEEVNLNFEEGAGIDE